MHRRKGEDNVIISNKFIFKHFDDIIYIIASYEKDNKILFLGTVLFRRTVLQSTLEVGLLFALGLKMDLNTR